MAYKTSIQKSFITSYVQLVKQSRQRKLEIVRQKRSRALDKVDIMVVCRQRPGGCSQINLSPATITVISAITTSGHTKFNNRRIFGRYLHLLGLSIFEPNTRITAQNTTKVKSNVSYNFILNWFKGPESGTVTIFYGSGSFRLLKSYSFGSDFWQVPVPVLTPYLDHKKLIFQKKIMQQILPFYTVGFFYKENQ
jgi:hypothetical protein